MEAPWIGSDETGTRVAGKKFWEWVWQSPLASYFVIDHRRGYPVVKEHFTESYQGVICHDCWSAQNNTPAANSAADAHDITDGLQPACCFGRSSNHGRSPLDSFR